MKINHIISETTAGSVASVAMPMGSIKKRTNEENKVKGLEPAEKVMSGKSKKKGPYQNSLVEGKMKELSMDLGTKNGLTDENFKKKYGKTKQEMRKMLKQNPTEKQQKVDEAKLDEEDIIIVPGHGMKRKNGFVQHGQSRVDHEVEMARSDVLATMKNAKAIYQLLQNRSEEQGLEGWVQEKLIKANDYLNSVKEYYDEKMMHEMNGGVIAGGGVGEAKGKLTYTPEPTEYGVFPDNKKEFVKTFLSKDLALAHIKKFGGKLVVLDQYGRRMKQGVAEGEKSPMFKDAQKADRIRSLKNLIPKYEEKAIAANRAGDDTKTKQYQQVVQKYKQELGKLSKEGVAEAEKQDDKKYKDEKSDSKGWLYNQQTVGWDKGGTRAPTGALGPNAQKLSEKAVSKAQQRFMGMAHAMQKGKKIPGASKELKDVAKGMTKKAARDFAATKHKGLPEKVKKD